MNVIPLSADRVHMLARDAKVMSHMVVSTMRTLGYEDIRSPSSRVDLLPIEREALIVTVDVMHPRKSDHDWLSQHNPHPTPKSEWDKVLYGRTGSNPFLVHDDA